MTKLAQKLCGNSKSAVQFHDLVIKYKNVSWPLFLRAWGEVRGCDNLLRNDDGSYSIETKEKN